METASMLLVGWLLGSVCFALGWFAGRRLQEQARAMVRPEPGDGLWGDDAWHEQLASDEAWREELADDIERRVEQRIMDRGGLL